MWATLLDRIRADLGAWPLRPEAAWLFGSAARGEAHAESDIDILLVRPPSAAGGRTEESRTAWQLKTQTLAENVRAWSGNACEILELDTVELAAAVERNDRLVRDLREQAVVLTGEDQRKLLRPQKRAKAISRSQPRVDEVLEGSTQAATGSGRWLS